MKTASESIVKLAGGVKNGSLHLDVIYDEDIMEQFLWVEKYRPKTVEECILPDSLKQTFQEFVDSKQIPNLILTGTPGTGKTSVAKAMLNQLGCDHMVINGSMNGNIDTLRNEIQQFASSVSILGGRKYVILDEADYLNAQSTQPALRNFMEEFSKSCGFILTCNYKDKIIQALHSRCSIVDFKHTKEDKSKMGALFFKRVCSILDDEGVKYNKEVVAHFVADTYPDFRRTLNDLQRYSATGGIDTGVLSLSKDLSLKTLVDAIREQKFNDIRKWVSKTNYTTADIVRKFYEQASEYYDEQNTAKLILILADYQHKAAFVADEEVNLVAMLTEIMIECQSK